MNPLRIEQMTIFDVAPAEVVTIAAKLGVPLVSLWTSPGMAGANPVTPANKPELLARLRDLPVAVDCIEAFALVADPAIYEADFALGAELGAGIVVAINVFEPDEDRTAEQLAAFCALAANYQLMVSLEFISMGQTRTPAQALRAVQQSTAANARITVDLLHLVRTGTFADLVSIPPELIGSAQICDGPASIAPADLIEEAAFSRMIPGEGTFPLDAFLRALPASAGLGMEVPLRRQREAGVSALARTQLVVEATRAQQAKLQAG